MSRPKGIVFDYGQVLSLHQNPERFQRLIRLSGMEPERFLQAYREHRREYDRGVLRGEQYWRRVLGGGNGASPGGGRLRELEEEDALSWMDLNEPLLAWALRLGERGLRTAVLSNMPREILERMRRDPKFGWMERFTVRVFSCELGLVKPEPEIYRRCLDRLGLDPREVLFLDDSEENVAGARRIGIEAVLYRAGEPGVEELEAKVFANGRRGPGA